MAAHLTDWQKKEIIESYLQLGSYNAVARKYGIAPSTVLRIVARDDETKQKAIEKKDENTKSILEYMETKKDVVNDIIGKGLTVLSSEEKLAEATPAQITTALGTLIDKFVMCDQRKKEDDLPYELPARVLGKGFVDINRQIVPNKAYIFEGGRGGLKSSYISLKIVELLKNNPQMHACIVRKVAATLKDSVYAQMKWAIHELGLDREFDCKVSPLEIVYQKKQKIYFRGCDDPMKLKGIKPEFGYVGILWKEEKDQLSGPAEERNVNQSVLRGGAESFDFSSYNPPKSKANWVNKAKIEPDENRVIHRSVYTDAPPEWLGTKFLEDAEHLKQVNPTAYEHEYLGIANGDGGNVFDQIECRDITDDEIKGFDRIFQGADWGWYPDPFAFVRVHYDKARETIFFIDEIYGQKLSNEASARLILEKGYNDTYTTEDSAEPKSVADHRAAGINAKAAVKGPGSVDYGMKWLQRRKLVIDRKRTPHVYEEFMNYEYERSKDGDIISGYPDANNHTIDATRYALERVFIRKGSSA